MKSISSSPNPAPGVSGELRRGRCDLGPAASTADVMREQMEFLMAHAGKACNGSCPECQRLERVKDYLLQEFTQNLDA